MRKAIVKATTRAAVLINPMAVILLMAQTKTTDTCIPLIVVAASVWIWIVLRGNIPEI
jgi:hypothetical protein